jgi:FeS assembly SUF system protein
MGILNLNSNSMLNAEQPDTPETAVNSDTVTAESTQDLPSPEPSPTSSDDPLMTLKLKPRIIEAISKVFDPEIPVNIYELGLIYDIRINADAVVKVQMTLTAPNCPAAQILPSQVTTAVKEVPDVTDATVEVVWEPPWDQTKMSDAAKLQLGLL